MASAGKIDALKTATNNLLTQLKSAAVTDGDVYVSIVPFVKDVNLGPANYNANWIDWTNGKTASPTSKAASQAVGIKSTPVTRVPLALQITVLAARRSDKYLDHFIHSIERDVYWLHLPRHRQWQQGRRYEWVGLQRLLQQRTKLESNR